MFLKTLTKIKLHVKEGFKMLQKEANGNVEFDKEVFKKRFFELRESMNKSQSEFAEFLGIPTGSVGGYESGVKTPNSATLFKVAKKCNVSSDYLLGLSNVKSIDAEVNAVCEYTGLSEKSVEHLHNIVLQSKNDFIEKETQDEIDKVVSNRNKTLQDAEVYYDEHPEMNSEVSLAELQKRWLEDDEDAIDMYLSTNSFKANLIKQTINLLLSHTLSEELLRNLSMYLQTKFSSNKIITAVIEKIPVEIDTKYLESAYLFDFLESLKKLHEEQALYSLADIEAIKKEGAANGNDN